MGVNNKRVIILVIVIFLLDKIRFAFDISYQYHCSRYFLISGHSIADTDCIMHRQRAAALLFSLPDGFSWAGMGRAYCVRQGPSIGLFSVLGEGR